jgi:putative nucleotidyltransferase with HDIG domain
MANSAIEQRGKMLREINKAIDELPILPSAITQLIGLSISDERYFEKVKELAEQDPTFAVRLIKLANSTVNAPLFQITSINHAISRIGTRHIKGLITTFAVAKIFVPSNKSGRDLWVHSIQVAVASQSIARMATRLNIDQEKAYLCGLLHDIGRFILFSIIPDGRVRIDEKDWQSPDKLTEAEQEVCGLTHAALGGYAAEKWGLPSEIVNVISNHHSYDYLTLTQIEKKEASLVKIVQMADYLSVLMMNDPDIFSLPAEELQQLIEDKCIDVSWDTPPVSSLLLQNEARNIYDKASKIVSGLGICVDEEP